MVSSVLVAGARTPFGRYMGSLKDFTAPQLGAIAIKGALEKASITPESVDYVIIGQAVQAGTGQAAARQAAAEAGIPMSVPAALVNKVCLSGINAIALADQMIRAGEADIVVAGGMESMSQAPHLLAGSRDGYKYGSVELIDSLANDGLHDSFTNLGMGLLTEDRNDLDRVSRGEQDSFAVRSHQLAARAWADGVFADEVVPVTIPQRRGEPRLLIEDEGIRADTTADSLSRLRPAFRNDGTITAGNASPMNDGAAAVVVMNKDRAVELGVEWLAEIGASGFVAGPDSTLQSRPAEAINAACAKAGISPVDLDVVEINEAFAAVGVVSVRELKFDPERVNVNGGAIAIGHPLGASGARIVLHLAHELARRGGGTGAAALCGGGGQGDALLLSVPAKASK